MTTILFFYSVTLIAQDTTKFYGGLNDGSSMGTANQRAVNIVNSNSPKFSGGGFDGTAITFTQLKYINTSGDTVKFVGGGFDGSSAMVSASLHIYTYDSDTAKYSGGNFDGYSISISTSGTINQNGGSLAKFKGGNFDGSASFITGDTLLNSITQSAVKFTGGSYDGFAVSISIPLPIDSIHIKLSLNALIEGFYNPVVDRMVQDTVTVYLRKFNAPYAVRDSALVVLDSTGHADIDFYNTQAGKYFIVIKHRNSIETWSRNIGTDLIEGNTFNIYDFTGGPWKAYNNNLIRKGTKWCIYSGDVNTDGVVDGADLSMIDNDAFSFLKGYLSSDVNGDDLVDGADLSITDNNASGFVSVQKPENADSKNEYQISKEGQMINQPKKK